ncbi:MAG: hypothetical protein WC023_06435 [Rhodocyclaceae bacterium]
MNELMPFSLACIAILAGGCALFFGQWLGGKGVRGAVRHAFNFARLS